MIAGGANPYLAYSRHLNGHGGGVHFHPVDGRLVFFAALLIAVMVAAGFALISNKCRCAR